MPNTISIAVARQCIKWNIIKKIPTMLWGPPGVGKSDLIYQIAAELSYSIIEINAAQRDPVDLRGLPLVDAATRTTDWLPPGELPNAQRDGEFGILFLDEVNTAPASMQAALFGLILHGRLGEYQLPPGWICIAAGNRLADRAAAQRMPTALKNRFAHFDVAADLNSWIEWAKRTGLPPILIAFIKIREPLLHVMPTGDENAFPTPRSWAKVARCIDAPADIRSDLMTAIVGQGPATELEGYVRIYDRMPSLDAIMTNPDSVPPVDVTQPCIMYAVATALSRLVKRETFGNAIKYCSNMAPDFCAVLVRDAVTRDENLKETEAFVNWALANREIVL